MKLLLTYALAAFLACMLLLTSTLAHAAPPLRVAVIDTGLDLSDERFKGHLCRGNEHRDFTGTGMFDLSGHGTHVTGLIRTFAGDTNYCLVIVKYWMPGMTDKATRSAFRNALAYAMSLDVTLVNISTAGSEFDKDEYVAIASHPHTTVVGAAGNNGETQVSYPCGYKLPNTRCVGAVDEDGFQTKMSNYGPWVKYWELGKNVVSDRVGYGKAELSGTSMACAIHSGKLIKKYFKKRS